MLACWSLAAAWCLGERRVATKAIKAGIICGSLIVPRTLMTTCGARVQLAREAALVPLPFMQCLVRRTHLLPFHVIWPQGAGPSSGNRLRMCRKLCKSLSPCAEDAPEGADSSIALEMEKVK